MVRLVLVKVIHHDPHKQLEDKVHSQEHKDVDIEGHELQKCRWVGNKILHLLYPYHQHERTIMNLEL